MARHQFRSTRVAQTEEGTGDKDDAEVEGPLVAMATAPIGPGLPAHQNRPPPPVAMASAPLFLATGQEASGHENIAGPHCWAATGRTTVEPD
jgi:hypothetical protein